MSTVYISDMRKLKYCSRGIRQFFHRHGLDYSLFLREGISSRELLSSSNNDAMAVAVVEVANGRKQ